MKYRWYLASLSVAVFVAALVACSDSGDSPTVPEEQPTISINDVTVDEGATAIFKVSLSKASTAPVRYTFATTDLTATAPGDYTAAGGTDTIQAGDTTAYLIVVTVDDVAAEADETFMLKITAAYGATRADSVGLATILDSDISFSSQVRGLLRASCAPNGACHGAGSAAGGMTLGTADWATVRAAKSSIMGPGATDSLVVRPFSSASSMLYLRTIDTPPYGLSRMPNTPPYLSTSQQALIRDWIDIGAPNN